MKTLETMNILEVLDQIGYIIKIEDIGTCITNQEKLLEFVKQEDELVHDFSKFMSFLKENEEYISKDKLVLNALDNCYEALRDIKIGKKTSDSIKEDVSSLEIYIKNAKQLLGEKNKTKIVRLTKNENGIIELKYIQCKEFFNSKLKKDKTEQISKIEEKISLEDVLKEIPVEDFHFFVEDNDLATGFMSKIIYNSFSDQEIAQKTKIRNLVSEDGIIKSSKSISFEKIKEEYMKTIKDYSKYIDLDKLLLTSAFRTIYNLENEEFSEGKTKSAKEKLDILEELLNNRKNNIEISGIIYEESESEEDTLEGKNVRFSKNNFKKLKNKFFYENKYYKGKELEQLGKDILEGKIELKDVDINVCNMLALDKNEIYFLMQQSDENCMYLLDNGLIKIEKVLENIEENGVSNKLIKYIYDNEYIDNAIISKLYNEGKISASSIGELRENENIQEVLTNKKFIDIYNEEKNKEDKTILQRYALLYRELKVKDKNNSELQKQANEFLIEMDEKFDQEDIKPLYKLGIIPIETALEWGGQGIAIEMLKEGILKPSDTKELFENGIITITSIENILQSIELDNTQKLDIIYSTFDEIDQGEIRNRLIQLLDVERTKREKEYNPGELRTRGIGTSKGKKTYQTDPCLRYKLIATLDDKYIKDLLLDGHMLFHLPNLNNGTYIIEKMFKDTKNGVKPDYGRATYILTEEDFIDNNKEIIDSDVINRQYLIGLKEDGKAVSLNHSSKWGDNLKRELEINESNSRYTQKDLENIDILVKNIEKSRKERE